MPPRGSGIWQEILPNFLATVLWQKNFYLVRAALGHKESPIGNVLFTSADPGKFSKVAKSCKFLKYQKIHD